MQPHTIDTRWVKFHFVRKILVSPIFLHCFTFSLRYFASRGPLQPFGFASLRQPDDFVAGASRLCVEINSRF